jgi:hypothetical protein
MQQGIFAMFGMVQQLLSHTGLAPRQQAGLQGMSASALAPTPTLASAPASAPSTVSSLAGISYSALFSPLPQVSLFQSPARPTLPESTSVLPSAVSEKSSVQQAPPQPQQQTQPEWTASPSDDGDDASRYVAVSRSPAP